VNAIPLLPAFTLSGVKLLPLRTRFYAPEWYVAPMPMNAAIHLIERYHYARSASNQPSYIHGLFLRGDFVNVYGVAYWIAAMAGTVVKYNPNGYSTTLALHRLVIHPQVPTNGASFLLGASIRAIKASGKTKMLVTYADTWQGHTGAIYRATNWKYEGMTPAYEVWVDAVGRQVSKKNGNMGRNSTNHAEFAEMGCAMIGKFRKHVFTMQLPLMKSIQAALFTETA
jgi:hypothetical protein